MLGLFRKMLSRAEPAPAAPVAKPASPFAAAKPQPAVSAPLRAPITPRPLRPTSPSVGQSRPVTPPSAPGTNVQIALAAIAAGLPESISHKVPVSPEQFVSIPVDKVLPQLAYGMVIMTVAELRECAPEPFAALAGNDDLEVALPLDEIVKQLSSTHFARREQTRVEVPAEVTSVFAAGVGGVSIAKASPAQPAPIARPRPTVTTTAAPAAHPPASTAAKVGSKISMSPQAISALGGKPTTPAPSGPRATILGGQKAAVPVQATPTPVPQRNATAASAKKPAIEEPKVTGELAVPLGFVCNGWVDEVRAQLVGVVVAEAEIQVPLELLQPAMQLGKVVFSWQEVASWIRPPLTIPPTPKVGEMPVEFPLKVVAPLFMAHHRAATQRRVAIDDTIPDLFGGGNGKDSVRAQVTQPSPPAGATKQDFAPPVAPGSKAAAAPVAAPIRMAAATPVAEPKSAPVAAEPPKSLEPSIEQVVGSADKRFSAKEIIANTARLPGVAGALLAMSDGLLVTSQVPPAVKAETIAAFLPQMFGRMNQYTKELALGPLHELTLGVESGQWHVYKFETIYFAALGKRGETLPLNLLAQVAAELSSQSK